MENRVLLFHMRPMFAAALGAVAASILAALLPQWTMLVLCAAAIPVSALLFRKRSLWCLLPVLFLLVSARAALLGDGIPELSWFTPVRESLKANADALFSDRAAAARGILLGDRSAMEAEETAIYAQSGLLHLFAVSGLHVTVLVGAFHKLVHAPKKWVTDGLTLLFALLLCALTGFSASVLRAAFMLIGIRITRRLDRKVDNPSVFCFAMAATLLVRPMSLFSVGFQLSFAAAGGMVLLSPVLRRPFRHCPMNRLVRALTAATSATVGMLPVAASYFGGVAWISIPLSIVLIPTMPILLILGFASVVLYGPLPHIAKLLSYPAYGAMEFLHLAASALDVPLLRLPAPHPLAIALWFSGLLFCSPLFLPNRHRPPWIGLGLVTASTLVWFLA